MKLEIVGSNNDYEVQPPAQLNFAKRSTSNNDISLAKRPIIYLNISDNIKILKNGI